MKALTVKAGGLLQVAKLFQDGPQLLTFLAQQRELLGIAIEALLGLGLGLQPFHSPSHHGESTQ